MSIKLRFSTTGSGVSRIISHFEDGFWATHVDAVMPDGNLLGAHAAGGVRSRSPDYDVKTVTRSEFIELAASGEVEAKFFAFLTDQIGKPYDFEAVFAFVAARNWREPKAWFCSELQTAALEAAGWFSSVVVGVNHIMPRDLFLMLTAMRLG